VDPAKERETWSLVDEAYAIQLAALYCDRFRRTKPAVLEMMEDMHAKLLSELGRLSEEELQLREEYEAKKREKETCECSAPVGWIRPDSNGGGTIED